MLFYNFNTLDDFINNNLVFNIKEEIIKLANIIDLYNNKKNIISLQNRSKKIDEILILATKLKEDLNIIISLHDKDLDNNCSEIKANLVEYNKKENELFQKILDFENMSTNILNKSLELPLKYTGRKVKKLSNITLTDNNFINTKIDINANPQDNNTLIISEKDQKAYLPFYYSEIEKIFKNSNNKYLTMQDVVNDLYVIPLDRFRLSSISRFKESFNLIYNKENASITKALDLGLELMFKYELNPIIIAACRNLDELDIYLDCLAENELFNFDCFEIKFEVAPQLIK